MKQIYIVVFILVFSSTAFNLNAADLTLGNSEVNTLTADATYDVITLNNGSKLIIPAGVTITATTLDVKNSAQIDLFGILNITGDVDVKNDAELTINNTGVMDVGGNFKANAGSSIINDGVVTVTGSYIGPAPTGGGSLTDSGGVVQLPVVLLFADAQVNDNEVLLSWATSAEINNDYFSVKISKDLNEWNEVDQVSGFGNTSSMTEYEFSFIPEYSGQIYVQLSQTDYDGTTEVLKVMTVNVKGGQYRVYPNPMREGQKLNIKGISSTDHVKVFNSAMVPVENIDNLERGFYYVVINDSNVQKLIVK